MRKWAFGLRRGPFWSSCGSCGHTWPGRFQSRLGLRVRPAQDIPHVVLVGVCFARSSFFGLVFRDLRFLCFLRLTFFGVGLKGNHEPWVTTVARLCGHIPCLVGAAPQKKSNLKWGYSWVVLSRPECAVCFYPGTPVATRVVWWKGNQAFTLLLL